jgi:hypothetical protein
MKKTLNLYNCFHNGDIFYSRVLIQQLIKDFNINYYHNLSSPLLNDIDGLTEITPLLDSFNCEIDNFSNDEINTWIGCDYRKYINNNNNGCNFENYMGLVKKITDYYGISINYNDILPKIFFEELHNYQKIKSIIEGHVNNYRKIILISNGNVHSGQSNNVDLTPIIHNLSIKNPNCLFLITQEIDTNQPNVISTFSITQTRPDLNQIGFISTYCNIIVGRSSGPHCFTHLHDNLLDETKTFISFSYNKFEGEWYSKYKCKQIWSNDFNIENIENVINSEINI